MNTFKTRRCDSSCHNAKGKVCKCWCQGRHHGLGTKKANEIFLENLADCCNFPINVEFVSVISPELEANFNELKMPTGKKKVAQ